MTVKKKMADQSMLGGFNEQNMSSTQKMWTHTFWSFAEHRGHIIYIQSVHETQTHLLNLNTNLPYLYFSAGAAGRDDANSNRPEL